MVCPLSRSTGPRGPGHTPGAALLHLLPGSGPVLSRPQEAKESPGCPDAWGQAPALQGGHTHRGRCLFPSTRVLLSAQDPPHPAGPAAVLAWQGSTRPQCPLVRWRRRPSSLSTHPTPLGLGASREGGLLSSTLTRVTQGHCTPCSPCELASSLCRRGFLRFTSSYRPLLTEVRDRHPVARWGAGGRQ